MHSLYSSFITYSRMSSILFSIQMQIMIAINFKYYLNLSAVFLRMLKLSGIHRGYEEKKNKIKFCIILQIHFKFERRRARFSCIINEWLDICTRTRAKNIATRNRLLHRNYSRDGNQHFRVFSWRWALKYTRCW